MTVKHVNESDLQKPKKVVIQSAEAELRVNSGDLLAGKNMPKKKVATMKYVHSQILKIREEDSHLGEDFGVGLKEHSHHHHHHLYHHDRDRDHHDDVESAMEVVMFTKPTLPSSPLSGKTPQQQSSRYTEKIEPTDTLSRISYMGFPGEDVDFS